MGDCPRTRAGRQCPVSWSRKESILIRSFRQGAEKEEAQGEKDP